MEETLHIFTKSYVEELNRQLSSPSVRKYYQDGRRLPIDEAKKLRTSIRPTSSVPTLNVADKPARDDVANAIALYEWLPSLTRTQASDFRLWVALAHGPFFEYSCKRWGAFTSRKDEDYIRRHWFDGAPGKAALRTQAISRLWWAAKLTWKPWERDSDLESFRKDDPGHYTAILLGIQQVYFDIVERDFGSNLRVRICLLDALSTVETSVGMTPLSGAVSKNLNLAAYSQNLDSLSVEALKKLCQKIVANESARLAAR